MWVRRQRRRPSREWVRNVWKIYVPLGVSAVGIVWTIGSVVAALF